MGPIDPNTWQAPLHPERQGGADYWKDLNWDDWRVLTQQPANKHRGDPNYDANGMPILRGRDTFRSGSKGRKEYGQNVSAHYARLNEYAAEGGDISGITAPEQMYGGSDAHRYQSRALAEYDKLQKTSDSRYADDYNQNQNPIMNSDPNGPVGGYVKPTLTYTGHTGSEKDGNVNVGTGGGKLIRKPMPSPAERIIARPDLQQGAAPRQLATAAPSNFAPVTPITNQASAAALRGGV